MMGLYYYCEKLLQNPNGEGKKKQNKNKVYHHEKQKIYFKRMKEELNEVHIHSNINVYELICLGV